MSSSSNNNNHPKASNNKVVSKKNFSQMTLPPPPPPPPLPSPPPRPIIMTTTTPAPATATTTTFHSTTERLPTLPSAPPSASTSFNITSDNNNLTTPPPPPPSTVVVDTNLPPPPQMIIANKPTTTKTKTTKVSYSPTMMIRTETPTTTSLSSLADEKLIIQSTNTTSDNNNDNDNKVSSSELEQPQQQAQQRGEPCRVNWNDINNKFSGCDDESYSILAKRQCHIPILVIATEAAHFLAWKNNIMLHDLFQGIARDLQQQQQSTTTTTTTTTTTSSMSMPLSPFRSATKSILLDWSKLHVDFVSPNDYNDHIINTTTTTTTTTTTMMKEPELHQHYNIDNIHSLKEQIQQLLDNDENHQNDNIGGGGGVGAGGSTDYTTSSTKRRQVSSSSSLLLYEASLNAHALTLSNIQETPFLIQYRQEYLDDWTNYMSHELFQVPPLVLYVCTTTKEVSSPVDCLRELSSPHFLPIPFHNGTYDPTSLRSEVLVLHDVQDNNNNNNGDDATTTTSSSLDLNALKQQLVHQFGGGAEILQINSLLPLTEDIKQQQQEEGDDDDQDLWMGHGSRGTCLSVNDKLVLRRYIATLITTSLLPSLERRISDLNFVVTDRKKGVKNVFKSLWRKPKEETPSNQLLSSSSSSHYTTPHENHKAPTKSPSTSSSSSLKYRYDSIESQVRLLADTLFLVRDWEAAFGMYRLIKDDYKADRAMLEYGSVNEMMALALYMMDASQNQKSILQEAFTYMETALISYTRAAEEERPASSTTTSSRPTQASPCTRLATRLCLVLASATEMTADRPVEVADLLASASSHETPLGAAVLLEQSSAYYYRAGMYRKYAFHMLMSGHMYRSALEEYHAFRCFTSALYIYHVGKWDELHNHLRSALAAQLYSLGQMSVSLELYAKLVGTRSGGRVSTKSQQKFIQHMVEICQLHTDQAMVGADRMSTERHADRLDRMEQVLQSTKGAVRVLELPNIDLPSVDDASVTMTVETEQDPVQIRCLGTMRDGDEAVWQELKCHAEAELKAVDPTFHLSDASPTLAKIEDPLIRRVVAAIDKDKTSMNLLAKAKRSSNHKETPTVRARMEPLSVQFVMTNPLSIPIEMRDLQLVARLTETTSQRVCTNEDAIAIGPHIGDYKAWTFSSSSFDYEAPDFCRMSPGGTLAGAWISAAEEAPFFVVTKMDSTLEPGSSAKVSLGICPLVLGDLEVVGVRCKLFDDVWVYHPFNVKGSLLQNTNENRANRARAESMLLKAKVEQDMPRLTARLIPNRQSGGDGPMLVGQVSSWTVRLFNVGTAPACRLSLKTNVPWVTVDMKTDSLSSPSKEGQPTPHSVGPSGTLVNLPLEDESLETTGVLQPGETVDIPVLIRTSMGGRHPLYLLYRYELHDPTSSSSTKKRWLQKMIDVFVSPSLTLTASLMPSFWKQHEHILSVEVTNYRSDASSDLDVALDTLVIVSRQYRMKLLEGQLGVTSAEESPFHLGWQERVTLHYLVIPVEQSSAPCVLSECQFSKQGEIEVKECAATSTTNYLCLERAQHEFQRVLKKHQVDLARAAEAEEGGGHPRSVAQIRRAKSSVSGVESSSDLEDDEGDELLGDQTMLAHPTSIAKLCPPDYSKSTLNMVCTWSAVGGDDRTDIVHGQHHVTRLSVRPTTSSRGCPITITCNHPTQLSHDFDKGPLSIPFEITVRNRLLDALVDFEFSLERPKSFDFIGAECFQWSLQGSEELTVPLHAVVPTGGVYNLQSVRLTVNKADKKVPYLFPLQWIVRVNA